MVTDIMDKQEPLRNKLRSLGTEALSDIHNFSYRTDSNLVEKNISKINEIVSFLGIAGAVGMISQMNHSILKKEFIVLKDSLIKHNNPISMQDFLNETSEDNFNNANSFNTEKSEENILPIRNDYIGHNTKNIQTNSTRIGVQKGSTLLKALKDIKQPKISKVSNMSVKNSSGNNFENLKKDRREAIIKIIKAKKEATITDIRMLAYGVLASCGEKTLQRELVSMVSDRVLNKVGEKRWSKYSLRT